LILRVLIIRFSVILVIRNKNKKCILLLKTILREPRNF
jgi:hypothetical protein